jgi:hypothetical protein
MKNNKREFLIETLMLVILSLAFGMMAGVAI